MSRSICIAVYASLVGHVYGEDCDRGPNHSTREGCQIIRGDLHVTPESNFHHLTSVTTVQGGINIMFNNATNLSFLENIRSVGKNAEGYSITLYQNQNLNSIAGLCGIAGARLKASLGLCSCLPEFFLSSKFALMNVSCTACSMRACDMKND